MLQNIFSRLAKNLWWNQEPKLDMMPHIVPSKHVMLFPGGYYIFGTRSWSNRDHGWLYHFPGQNTPYLVSGAPIRVKGAEIFVNFCPGSLWQYNPKILTKFQEDLSPAQRPEGPIILSKVRSDLDVWTKEEVLQLLKDE